MYDAEKCEDHKLTCQDAKKAPAKRIFQERREAWVELLSCRCKFGVNRRFASYTNPPLVYHLLKGTVAVVRSCFLACLSFSWPFAILEAVALDRELQGDRKSV